MSKSRSRRTSYCLTVISISIADTQWSLKGMEYGYSSSVKGDFLSGDVGNGIHSLSHFFPGAFFHLLCFVS
jgi:hypothetical protein